MEMTDAKYAVNSITRVKPEITIHIYAAFGGIPFTYLRATTMSNSPGLLSESYADEQSRTNLFSLLPPELTVEIFVWFCEERRNFVVQQIENGRKWSNSDLTNYLQLQNPLKLGQICKKWRNIAWCTPELWDTLIVVVSVTYGNTEYPMRSLIEEYLSRGAELPLNIYIYIPNSKDGTSVAELSSVYTELFKHASRWYNGKIYIPGSSGSTGLWDDCLTSIQRRIVRRLPRLNTLRIVTLESRANDPFLSQTTVSIRTRNVHNLEKLYIASGRHSLLKLPWSQLTAYSNDFAWDSPATIIRKTLRLQECGFVLAFPYIPNDFSKDGELVTLSRLMSLRVQARATEQVVKSFANIKTPSLLHLDIHVHLINAGEMIFLLRSMIIHPRLSHPLRTLKFSMGMCHFEDYIDLFEVIPALEELSMELTGEDRNFYPGINNRFLNMLHPFQQPNGQKALLTNLRLFHYVGPLLLSGNIFVDIMETRWIYGGMDEIARLEDVRLVLSGSSVLTLGSKEEARLKDLRDEGMVVDIYGKSGQFEV